MNSRVRSSFWRHCHATSSVGSPNSPNFSSCSMTPDGLWRFKLISRCVSCHIWDLMCVSVPNRSQIGRPIGSVPSSWQDRTDRSWRYSWTESNRQHRFDSTRSKIGRSRSVPAGPDRGCPSLVYTNHVASYYCRMHWPRRELSLPVYTDHVASLHIHWRRRELSLPHTRRWCGCLISVGFILFLVVPKRRHFLAAWLPMSWFYLAFLGRKYISTS